MGDRDYDPLFPYGWGLRTDRLSALEESVIAGTAPAGWAKTFAETTE